MCLEDRYYLLINILHAEYAWHPWVYERCREVEAAPNGYIDIWGRGHFKSTLITYAGIIQEVLKDRELSVGIFSHTNPTAKAFLAQIKRDFEANEDLKELFPDVLYANPEKESPSWSLDAGLIVKRVGNPKEATIEAHGLVDGQPTSKHFKLMVYDDVVTDKSVYTSDQITRTTESWSLSDNLGSTDTRKWYVGTRYHYADTYQEIMKRGAAKPRIYPATDDGLISGNPVLLTRPQWEDKLKNQLESTVACQLLCDPQAGNQRMFNVQDLQTYEVRPLTLMAYLLIDPARSVKKESANTAMVVLGIDAGGNKYLLDGIDHKIDLMDRWRWMRDLWTKWVRAPGIVGLHVGYERYGAIADLDYFHERQGIEKDPMTGRLYAFEIEELEWPRDGQRSKEDRVQRLVPDIRGHRFYLPYATDQNRLTTLQRKMISEGYEYRLASPIIKIDENGHRYDLTERFKLQVSYFPFGGLVDVIDAASRIYDIDPRPPVHVEAGDLEPDLL